MSQRQERLPPSARRVFTLAALAAAAYVGYRTFIQQLIPAVGLDGLKQDLAVTAGRLACAAFCFWLARLRYSRDVLGNLPGRALPTLVAAPGLLAAAAIPLWGRAASDWNAAYALPRAVELAVAWAVAANEEISFRGALFLSAKEWGGARGTAWALVVSSLGFTLFHLGYQSVLQFAFIFPVGLALGLARLRGATLLQLIVLHAAIDSVEAAWLPTTPLDNPWLRATAAGLALATALALWLLPAPPAVHAKAA